jgi:arylsulfatase A
MNLCYFTFINEFFTKVNNICFIIAFKNLLLSTLLHFQERSVTAFSEKFRVFNWLLISTFFFSTFLCFSQEKKPNIIFILSDDLGYMDLGCYGNPYNETPNIDALAKNGIRFTQAYSASPVCSPSRAAIMTGKYPARLKLTNFLVGERIDSSSNTLPAKWRKYLSNSETTLAEQLKTLGYQTGMVGKWHLGSQDSLAPWSQGFDYTRMIGKNGLDYFNYSIFEDSYNKEFIDDGKDYLTDKLSDYAVNFINTSNTEKPFFLYLCYSAPHVFIVPKADKLKKYFLKYEKFNGTYNPYYATMVESMDEGVGRIIQTLKEKNALENTVIIFTSDNGGVGLPELGPIPTNSEPLKKWKGHLYEGGIRIPTLISWKGKIEPNQTCNQYFINTDYFPTILEMVGQNYKPMLDAKSILPLLFNPQMSYERGPIFWHYPHFSNQLGRPSGAVRKGDWKLIENFETSAFELYNLKNDLSEKTNMINNEIETSNELKGLLKEWQKSINANMPIQKM